MLTAGSCSVPALWISNICPLAHPSRKPWMSAGLAPLGIGTSLPRATPSWLHFGAGEMFPRVSPAHLGSGTCRSLRCSPCVPSSVGANTTTTPGRALVAPTFLALKTGREQAALLFSVDGAGTGPSGCSRDTAAAQGGAVMPHPVRSGRPRCTLVPAPFCPSAAELRLRAADKLSPISPGSRAEWIPAWDSLQGKHQQLQAWLTCLGSSASSAVPLAGGTRARCPRHQGALS